VAESLLNDDSGGGGLGTNDAWLLLSGQATVNELFEIKRTKWTAKMSEEFAEEESEKKGRIKIEPSSWYL
jgi:hypothetical protein